MIYTSYFGNNKNFPINARVFSVALKRISSITRLDVFTPEFSMIKGKKNGTLTEHGFEVLYLRKLKNNVEEEYVQELKKAGLTRDIILCCFEKSEDFCHRHILARYLNETYSMDIKEL